MSDTFSQIYIQIVFAVKHRQGLIDPGWEFAIDIGLLCSPLLDAGMLFKMIHPCPLLGVVLFFAIILL
jgi:hypothetical protein